MEVQRRNDQRELRGSGWALGALFRSGGFCPFVTAPMSELLDQRVPMAQLFGQDAVEFARRIVDSNDDEERLTVFSTFLRREPGRSERSAKTFLIWSSGPLSATRPLRR